MKLSAADRAKFSAVALFSGLDAERLAWMEARTQGQAFPAGATLFVQDEPADRFFLLLEGWVKLARFGEEGTEAIVHVVAPGETFAEAALFAQGVYPVSAEAVTDVRVLGFSAMLFRDLVVSHGDVALAMLGALSTRLRRLVGQLEQLQVQTAPQRVADFLLRLCDPRARRAVVALPVNKALIARRLGMRPETFSRALAKLRDVGVEQAEGRIEIADTIRLKAFALETPAGWEG